MDVNPDIFKQDMIGGEVGAELSSMATMLVGQAFGTLIKRQYGVRRVLIGYDMRNSSRDLLVRVAGGLQAAGCDVYEIGMVATPILHFNALRSGLAGVMITSQAPNPTHNGLRLFVGKEVIGGEKLQQMHTTIETNDFESAPGNRFQFVDGDHSYMSFIASGFRPTAKLSVVINAANGMAGLYAPKILGRLGHEVMVWNETPAPNFKTLDSHTITDDDVSVIADAVTLQGADLGLYFNPDVSQVGVLDELGNILTPQQVGRWLYSKLGYAAKPEMKHLLQGKLTFPDRYFDIEDGIYAAGRIIELLAEQETALSEQITALEESE